MKYNLNSNLLPILSVAMYGTHLEAESTMHSDCIQQDFEDGEIPITEEQFWDNFDNEKYVKHIEDLAKECYDGEYSVMGIKVILKLGEIYSPRYYNFANDNIDIEVIVSKTALLKFAKDNREEFSDFLKRHYTSYDGFNSFTANNYKEWLEEFKSDNDQEVGAILRFLFECQLDNYDPQVEDIMDFDHFVEIVHERTFYTEFIDDAYYNKMEQAVKTVRNYVQRNYLTIDLDNFDCEEIFDTDELEDAAIVRLVQEEMDKIARKTGKLNLQ